MLDEEKVRKTSGECQRWQLREFDLGVDRWLDLDGADAEDRVRWRCLVELGIKQKPATRVGPRRWKVTI